MNAARSRRTCRPGLSTRVAAGKISGLSPAARVGLGCRRIDVVRVKSQLVVNLALLGIAQDVVRFRDGLELLLGRLVPGIKVRMIFPRELAERLANFFRRRALLYSQLSVIVFVLVRHRSAIIVAPATRRLSRGRPALA